MTEAARALSVFLGLNVNAPRLNLSFQTLAVHLVFSMSQIIRTDQLVEF